MMEGGVEATKTVFGLDLECHSHILCPIVARHVKRHGLQVSMQPRWEPPPRVGCFDLSPDIACQNKRMFVELLLPFYLKKPAAE